MQDFPSGAVGAAVGEWVGELQHKALLHKLEQGTLTLEQVDQAREKAISLARFVGAATVFALDGDVATASQAAANSAENNAFHKILDGLILAYDFTKLGHGYITGDEEQVKEALKDLGVDVAGMLSPSGNLNGYIRLLKAGSNLARKVKPVEKLVHKTTKPSQVPHNQKIEKISSKKISEDIKLFVKNQKHDKKLKGANHPKVREAILKGQKEHKKLAEKIKKKQSKNPGWKTEQFIAEKKLKPDVLTPSGRPIELKPNTPSGRKAGKKQLKKYEEATGKKGKVIYYD